MEKAALEHNAAAHGLGVITAAIFLAGEMAGSGVLALPNAIAGTGKTLLGRFRTDQTLLFCHIKNKRIRRYLDFRLYLVSGWGGIVLIFMFTVNACFSGTRLGLCWVMLEERYDEFRREIRDPYPSIGEKAVGAWGR